MRNTDTLDRADEKTGKVGEKHLTVFICADDSQTEPHLDEVPIFADLLDGPPILNEVGSMGGDDRWRVIELCNYGSAKSKQAPIWVAIVERIDQPSTVREMWMTLACRHQALHLYMAGDHYLDCFLSYENAPPTLNEALLQDSDWKVDRFETHRPEGSAAHFDYIYLAHCVHGKVQVAA